VIFVKEIGIWTEKDEGTYEITQIA